MAYKPLSQDYLQSGLNQYVNSSQQQSTPEPVVEEKGWGERIKDDIVNTVSNYLSGAQQGVNEMSRAQDAQMGDPLGQMYSGNGFQPASEETNQWVKDAQSNFMNETALPTLAVVPGYTLPAVGTMLGSHAVDTYQNTEGNVLDKAGNAVRSITYGPAVDMATDPNLGQRFHDRPISTLAEGAMVAGQALLPFVGARRGVQKAGELKNELVAHVESKLNEITDNPPLQNIGIRGLDALDQVDSPTRGFRPATPEELSNWNAEQRTQQQSREYGEIFDQQPQARFGNETVLSDMPQRMQGEAVSPLLQSLEQIKGQKFDEATGQSYANWMQRDVQERQNLQNQKNDIAGSVLMSPLDRMEVGADLPNKRPYSGGNTGYVLGEQPQPRSITIPAEIQRRNTPQPEPVATKPFSIPTAQDLVTATQKKILDSQLTEAVNTKNYDAVQKVITKMQREGIETPLSRSVINRNIEYSRSSSAQATESARPLNTDNVQNSLLSKAHEAAMKDDYQSAYQYAEQAGHTEWARAYKALYETSGGEAPTPPRLGGKVKGEYTGDTISKKTLLSRAQEIFAPIRTGRIGRANVEGFVNHNTGVIRTRSYGDLDVSSHEIGHMVDAALGLRAKSGMYDGEFIKAVHSRFGAEAYEPAQVRAEGIAEFTKDYVSNPELARKTFPKYYSAFEEALSKNADVRSRVNEFRDMVQAWNNQAPEARGRSGVSYAYENKPSLVQRAKDSWYGIQEKWYDAKVGLAKLTAEAEKLTGEKLATENNPYKMARLAQSSATARAQMLVEGTSPEMVQKVLNKNYGGSIKNPVTIKEILDGLNDPVLKKENPNYLKKGNYKDWNEALDTLLVARRQLELQQMNADYVGSMSRKDAEAIVNNAPKQLQDLTQKVYQYNNNILSILSHEGMIKPEVYNELTSKYKNYVSMAREFTDEAAMEKSFGMGKGFGNVRSALKSISEEGSARQVISPLESMVKNTYAMLNLVERNRVGKIFSDLAEKQGVGKLVEEVHGTSSTKDSTFSVWKDGVKSTYQTTPDLYRAIMSMNQESANVITKILSTPASWLRAGATLTPDFALKNFARDTASALVFSRYGFRPVIDHFKGLSSLLKQDELYHEYKASGAMMSTMTGLDRNYTYDSMQKLFKGGGWKEHNPIELLRAFSEAVEGATRIGEFSRARSKGASLADAGLSARDVTLDFGKAGTWGRMANKIIPFFNAALQEPARIGQAFKENPLGTSSKLGMYIVAPSVLLWSMNHDQDWYKELPQYQKDLFWVFKAGDTVYRVPKPFGLGVLFGSGTERMLDYYVSKDPKTMSRWAKTTLDAFHPNIMPTVFSAISEWNSNYSSFLGRNIVPQKELNLPDAMQYGPDTSTTAKYIGEKLDLSPRKLDYLAQSLGGGMARQSLNIVDAVKGDRPYKNPLTTSFTVDPVKSPQSLQDFYGELNEAEKNHNAAKLTKAKLSSNEQGNYDKLTGANKGMSALNKQEREVLQSNLSEDQKRAKVEEINKRQMLLAQAVLKSLKR